MSRAKRFDLNRIRDTARELRKNMTDSERILWQEVRGRRLKGYKFLRQYPVLYQGNLIRYNYFIADFYCHEKKVVIEIDGPIHECNEEYDSFRDEEMLNLGLHIIRIKNDELTRMDDVLQKIISFLDSIK